MKVTENRTVVIELTGKEFDDIYNVLSKHSIHSHMEVGLSREQAQRVGAMWEEMNKARKGSVR